MAKFFGNIGYVTTIEQNPGNWVEEEITREYYGDVIKETRRLENSSNLNDNVTISNKISIVADPFANENIYAMRYVEYMGSKWKIKDVEVQYPRLILTIGDLYNG